MTQGKTVKDRNIELTYKKNMKKKGKLFFSCFLFSIRLSCVIWASVWKSLCQNRLLNGHQLVPSFTKSLQCGVRQTKIKSNNLRMWVMGNKIERRWKQSWQHQFYLKNYWSFLMQEIITVLFLEVWIFFIVCHFVSTSKRIL